SANSSLPSARRMRLSSGSGSVVDGVGGGVASVGGGAGVAVGARVTEVVGRSTSGAVLPRSCRHTARQGWRSATAVPRPSSAVAVVADRLHDGRVGRVGGVAADDPASTVRSAGGRTGPVTA